MEGTASLTGRYISTCHPLGHGRIRPTIGIIRTLYLGGKHLWPFEGTGSGRTTHTNRLGYTYPRNLTESTIPILI